jgi:uncharacterized protein with NRDE domain
MCLILLSWQQKAEHPLIVAANRDEFYARPTRPADYWPEHPQILAGLDLEFGGSWLGISRNGRFAAVTNLREVEQTGELSRGNLVKNFLLAETRSVAHLSQLEATKADYRPYNFIVFDGETLAYSNNVETGWHLLTPGSHAIGNLPLGTTNEKANKGKRDLDAALHQDGDHMALLNMLQDKESVGTHKEAVHRALSSRFVRIADVNYGTRSSSILHYHRDGSWNFWEQLYNTNATDADFLQPQSLSHFNA